MKDLALKLMQKIKEQGLCPTFYLYNVTVSGFCWVDLIEDAFHQLRLMQEEGLLPNEVTFTILIGAHGRAGEIDRGIGLFNRMNADGCSTPDRCTYNTLLKSLCRSGRELDALSLVHTTSKRGFFPNRLAYEKSHHYFCACHMSIPAFRIFEEMVACNLVPCLYRWNLLLYILCEEKKLREAYRVCDVMFERGFLPDESVMRFLVETSDKHPLLLVNHVLNR
ncbi:PREDICTED: pentatricopeptide repeat-containing protein At5g62370-like [Populus euphratica]|uniref:Pentatricopeptide repeat-containing protein At5g62370-like n=1 Tax=Populus euphratica TaxID=75702 RepID=A0AAJ6X634_POPEU|nr:PREDICTED: pentatricopeptide repeat-containing protein At5g62370-like [Populus euphratica]